MTYRRVFRCKKCRAEMEEGGLKPCGKAEDCNDFEFAGIIETTERLTEEKWRAILLRLLKDRGLIENDSEFPLSPSRLAPTPTEAQ